MKLKNNLRTLVRQRGMTVTALSQQTGVPLQTLNNWMAGAPPRNINQVKTVATYLELTIDSLVFGNGELGPNEMALTSIGNYEVFLRRSPNGQ